MKFNTLSKLLIVTVLIAYCQCSKLNRIKSSAQNGDGSWETGYSCPSILMAAKGKEFVEQGAGKFFPKNFVDAQVSPEDKIGLVIEFTK